jgi:UDP-N-acetylmuramoyl-L-alanyl-D-glutamate--2,6-diaminopimelate ligase
MKDFLRKYLPQSFIKSYHRALVFAAAMYYGFPADRMIIIGVTGTKGKTSTTNFIADMLEASGVKVAALSSALYRLPGKSWINASKMTMPGRTQLQRFLQKAHRAGCKYVVIETSSEGIAQHRTTAISYDVAVFTNISPEHIESHGSFEKYKKAKQRLFQNLVRTKHKQGVKKVSVINLDDELADDFLKFPADLHYGFSTQGNVREGVETIEASNIQSSHSGLTFDVSIDGLKDSIFAPISGSFHAQNLLAAIAVLRSQNISWKKIKESLTMVKPVVGRMQFVCYQNPFTVIVDYAHEPKSLEVILREAKKIAGDNKVIALTGAQGGGRDHSKRPKMGAVAKRYADFTVVTNEDPYDEDPEAIIKDVASGILDAGGKEGQDFVTESARAEGIRIAIKKAQAGDVVVLAGKGSETVMAVAQNKKVPWSDTEAAEKVLRELNGKV